MLFVFNKANVKPSLPIFKRENDFFIFYNVPLLLFKSAFCSKFTASFLLLW